MDNNTKLMYGGGAVIVVIIIVVAIYYFTRKSEGLENTTRQHRISPLELMTWLFLANNRSPPATIKKEINELIKQLYKGNTKQGRNIANVLGRVMKRKDDNMYIDKMIQLVTPVQSRVSPHTIQ